MRLIDVVACLVLLENQDEHIALGRAKIAAAKIPEHYIGGSEDVP